MAFVSTFDTIPTNIGTWCRVPTLVVSVARHAPKLHVHAHVHVHVHVHVHAHVHAECVTCAMEWLERWHDWQCGASTARTSTLIIADGWIGCRQSVDHRGIRRLVNRFDASTDLMRRSVLFGRLMVRRWLMVESVDK